MPSALAVQRDGHAALEADHHVLGLVGRLLRPRDELEHVVARRLLEVLDRPALGGAAPEVVVDRVRRRLGSALDGDAVLARVGDLLLAAHLPAAHRRDDLHLGVERDHGRLDPNLVVALAGAAVGNRVAARTTRVLDRQLRDQRPPERREQRIAAAVQRVRLDRRHHVVARELLARVDHVAVERAQVERLALHDLVVLAGLAQVDGERDDLGLVLVLDPLEHHARVEPARVEQEHPPDLAGLGLVGGGLRQRAALDAHAAAEASSASNAAQSLVDLRLADGQRRQEADRVGAGRVDDEVLLEQQPARHLGRSRHVDADHQAKPARLESERRAGRRRADSPRSRTVDEEGLVVDRVEHGVRGG